MAYDEKLAARVRQALAARLTSASSVESSSPKSGRGGVEEKKMFGGLTFMLRGSMCCGVLKEELILRVGPDRAGEALKSPHARPFDFTGRPMKGIITVAPAGCRTSPMIKKWVGLAVDFAQKPPRIPGRNKA